MCRVAARYGRAQLIQPALLRPPASGGDAPTWVGHGVNHPIAITDVPLEAEIQTATAHDVVIDNFSFTPATPSVPVGTTITWTNRDDLPHNVVSTEQKFKSPVLDTDEHFSHRFVAPGAYEYFCSIHPKMTGRIVVG